MPTETLTPYATPATMTAAGRHAPLFDDLPTEVAELAAVVQGLIIHEHLAAPLYGVTLTDEARSSVHVRPVEGLLDRLLALDDRPLTTVRPPDRRVAGNCRHVTVMMVAMLRHQGVPARARCGFGGYFGTSKFEDHWVCEYWNSDQQRWVLVDAQIDDVQRANPDIDFDTMDVPRHRFVIAGDAWTQCRAGEADPGAYGFSLLNQGGYWWIAGNLVRDVAALNNAEMLPWDVWGTMPGPDEPIADELTELFDRLAVLTHDPDVVPAELRARYQDDERLLVPPVVHNAITGQDETV
jgi:hypothetical protein